MINVNMTDKAGVTLATAGKYCADNVKVTPSAEILRKDEQAKTATPTTSAQDITPDAGKALSKVTVNPITAAIVGNLDASSFAASIVATVEGKGVTVPSGTLIDGMAALIESIQAGGGGSGTVSGYATGTYTVASDITIGINISNAVKIDTGLSEVKIFAFSKNFKVSSASEYELLSGIWVYNNGDYYGIRYHKNTSINTARYSVNANNQNTANDFYNEGNGVMSIRGLTTSTKIFAGTEYLWLAI